jgi:hypothetical protein
LGEGDGIRGARAALFVEKMFTLELPGVTFGESKSGVNTRFRVTPKMMLSSAFAPLKNENVPI